MLGTGLRGRALRVDHQGFPEQRALGLRVLRDTERSRRPHPGVHTRGSAGFVEDTRGDRGADADRLRLARTREQRRVDPPQPPGGVHARSRVLVQQGPLFPVLRGRRRDQVRNIHVRESLDGRMRHDGRELRRSVVEGHRQRREGDGDIDQLLGVRVYHRDGRPGLLDGLGEQGGVPVRGGEEHSI